MIAARFDPRAAIRSRLAWSPSVLGWLIVALAVVGIAWVLVTGLLARSHLSQVRSELPKLRSAIASGDMNRAHALARDIAANADSAHGLTTGPAWWVSANIPVLGSPLQTSRTITAQAARVGQQVLPGVLDLADDLTDIHTANSTIDLSKVANAAPRLRSAAEAAHTAAQAIDQSSSSWLGYVSSARSSMVSTLDQLDGELSGASRATGLLLPMLGQSGEQRYMLGFMNEAESRGLGGIPGAFAIVTADKGQITFTHFGSDEELLHVKADVDLGADYTSRYGPDDPTGDFRNSDISPDFRDAAQIWAGMWQKKTGQKLDGALAIDPTALSYLLKVTGPALLADGSHVTAQTVVALTQQTQYQKYASNTAHDKAERKAYLAVLAKAISQQVTKRGDSSAMVQALTRSARERRLVVWSRTPALEQQIVDAGWGGILEATGPTSGFVVNNAAGSKLDYYLQRSMTYHRADCGPSGVSVATLTLTNAAPRSGLPAYVTIRGDEAPAGAKPGDNRLLVTYYATPGARLLSTTLDGKALIVATVTEKGLVTATVDLELPAGASRTLQLTLAEPAAHQNVQILTQPLVNPMGVRTVEDC